MRGGRPPPVSLCRAPTCAARARPRRRRLAPGVAGAVLLAQAASSTADKTRTRGQLPHPVDVAGGAAVSRRNPARLSLTCQRFTALRKAEAQPAAPRARRRHGRRDGRQARAHRERACRRRAAAPRRRAARRGRAAAARPGAAALCRHALINALCTRRPAPREHVAAYPSAQLCMYGPLAGLAQLRRLGAPAEVPAWTALGRAARGARLVDRLASAECRRPAP